MMYFTYRRIKKKVLGLASKIGVPANLLPYYKYSNGEQSPLIEVDKNGNFHYIQIERGKEFERKNTDKLDELLYWIFSDVTFWLAINFELNNRIDKQDNRRITFE